MSLEVSELARLAAEHEEQFPEHGVACACMDPLIRAVVGLCEQPFAKVHDPDERGKPARAQRRVAYVLRTAARKLVEP